jgi:hypothetical protein
MWIINTSIFLFGILLFTFIAYRKGLYKSSGVLHRTRAIYGMAISLFLTIITVLQLMPSPIVIAGSIVLGVTIVIPWIFYLRANYKKRLIESRLYLRRKPHEYRYIWLVIVIVGFPLLFDSQIGQRLLNEKWPMLGLCCSWVLLQAYTLYYVSCIEKRIGKPIVEETTCIH